ncbi:hypothetical protein M3J09_012821 [Ascochyta lentis]
MYEHFDHAFKPHLPKMLPMLSPPPYAPFDHRASASGSCVERRDDYRCTISKPSSHFTIVSISVHLHKHIDLDRVPCWRLRRKLVALDQPICAHRCTSDPAFFRAVRRRTNSICISFGSREYLPFFGRWRDKSRIWRCMEEECNMSAWITQDCDSGNIRLHARTHYVGELSEEDAFLLEIVKTRAVEGGGLRYE